MIHVAVTPNPSNENLSFRKNHPWLGVEENRVRVWLESSPVASEALVRDGMRDATKTHEDKRHLSKHCIVSLSLCDCSDTVASYPIRQKKLGFPTQDPSAAKGQR